MVSTPRLEIHPGRVAANTRSVLQACRRHGARVACVTKAACAHPALVGAFEAGGADQLADSRLRNLAAIAATGSRLPLMLLRLPEPSAALEAVRHCQVSLNSSSETLRLLSEAAQSLRRIHQVIVMVDLGDLREGVWPDQAVQVVKGASRLPGLEVLGLGCNLGCFSGVLPSEANMRVLVETRDACRRETGLDLPVLSGGSSSILPLLASGRLPAEINHLRLGEVLVLGVTPQDRAPWPGTRQDAFRLVAEVIEVARKPSLPIGERGQDAFGQVRPIEDRGRRRRAILNLGRQDAALGDLTPEDPGMVVLGGSSDHLVLDVEDAVRPVATGDEVSFRPGYAALLALATSHYVRKVVMAEPEQGGGARLEVGAG